VHVVNLHHPCTDPFVSHDLGLAAKGDFAGPSGWCHLALRQPSPRCSLLERQDFNDVAYRDALKARHAAQSGMVPHQAIRLPLELQLQVSDDADRRKASMCPMHALTISRANVQASKPTTSRVSQQNAKLR